jgi:hypothetical protein
MLETNKVDFRSGESYPKAPSTVRVRTALPPALASQAWPGDIIANKMGSNIEN